MSDFTLDMDSLEGGISHGKNQQIYRNSGLIS